MLNKNFRLHRSPDSDNSGGQGENVQIDLDALSRPDGASAIPGESGTGDFDTSTLRNIDQDMDNQMGNVYNSNDSYDDNGNEQNSNQQNHQQQSQEKETYDPSLDTKFHQNFINKLYDKYGDDFELPEGTNAENFYDKIEEAIANVHAPRLHPDVIKMQNAVDAGVDPREYISRMTDTSRIESMDADSLVRISLQQNFGKSEKRPNGWDESKIEDTIKKMDNSGLLEIEAEKIRTKYVEEKEGLADRLAGEAQQRRQHEYTQMSQARETQIKDTLGSFQKMNDVFGIQLSQSEKADFSENFRYLVTPDEKTGVAPMVEMLQSNENLAKVAYLLSKGDSKVRQALTNAKEGGKRSFLDKLDPEPRVAKKSGTAQGSEIDLDALAAPERV